MATAAVLVAAAALAGGCGTSGPSSRGAPVSTPATSPPASETATPRASPAPSSTGPAATATPAADAGSTGTPAPADTATPVPTSTVAPARGATAAAASTPAPTSTVAPARGDTPVAASTPAAATVRQDRAPAQEAVSTRTPGLVLAAASSSVETKGSFAQVDEGMVYTWQDGDRTRRLILQSGLVVQPSTKNTPADVVEAVIGGTSIVRRQAHHEQSGALPVFRSATGGSLVTFPGGVILVLDAEWDQARVARFLAENGIAMHRVQSAGSFPNGFFVETEPGFPSLDLANQLVTQEGVLHSIPNWESQVEPR